MLYIAIDSRLHDEVRRKEMGYTGLIDNAKEYSLHDG